MKQFLSRFFWTAVAAGILYGGYVLCVQWWANGGSEKAASTFATIKTQASKVVGTAVTQVGETAGNYLKQKAGETLSSVAKSALTGALSFLEVSSTSASIAPGTVVAPTGSSFDIPPPPATIVTKVNQAFAISVNSGTSYTVDWGDGKFESDTTTANAVRLLSHAWAAAGDFMVKVTVKNGDGTDAYSFPVRVLE